MLLAIVVNTASDMATRGCGLPSTPFAALSDEVMQLYVLSRLSLEDLCAFGRCSKRCSFLERTAGEAWAAIHQELFGGDSGLAKPHNVSWREDVRVKYVQGWSMRVQKRLARRCDLAYQVQVGARRWPVAVLVASGLCV